MVCSTCRPSSTNDDMLNNGLLTRFHLQLLYNS